MPEDWKLYTLLALIAAGGVFEHVRRVKLAERLLREYLAALHPGVPYQLELVGPRKWMRWPARFRVRMQGRSLLMAVGGFLAGVRPKKAIQVLEDTPAPGA